MMDFQEVWKPVPSWPEYAVSSKGRIKRVAGGRGATAGRIMKQRPNRDGYLCVTLKCKAGRSTFLVSRIVCEAFYGVPPSLDFHAAHRDGDRSNNRITNLRWASKAENEADKEVHGTRPRGEAHANSKLTIEQVVAIRSDRRPQAQIAKELGVSQSLVCQVRTKKVWADL